MAVIAGNLELADVIQFHKPEDIGEKTLRTDDEREDYHLLCFQCHSRRFLSSTLDDVSQPLCHAQCPTAARSSTTLYVESSRLSLEVTSSSPPLHPSQIALCHLSRPGARSARRRQGPGVPRRTAKRRSSWTQRPSWRRASQLTTTTATFSRSALALEPQATLAVVAQLPPQLTAR